MKPRFAFRLVRSGSRNLAIALVSLLAANAASATSATWTGTTDALWATLTNWSANPVPGTGDTATFNAAAGTGGATIDLGTGVTVNSILFDTSSVAAYTIGAGALNSQTLALNNGGSIILNSTVANNELFNAGIVLGTDASTQGYTFTNDSTSKNLTFAGNISGGTGGTAGTETLTINGAGNTIISGIIGNGGATAVALNKSGTGTVTLSNANTYTGATTVTGGTLTSSSNTTPFGSGGGGILLGDTTPSNSNNAALSYSGTSTTVAGAITVQAGSSGTLSLLGLTNTNTFTGTIALNNNLTVGNDTSGKTTTFTGAVTENASAQAISKLGGAGGVTFSTAATTVGAGGLTLNSAGGGLLSFTGGIGGTGNLVLNNNGNTTNGITITTTSNVGTITNSGTGGVSFLGTGGVLISGAIGGTGTNVVQNSATSALSLSGTNTYTGSTTATKGILYSSSNTTPFGSGAGGILLGDTTSSNSNNATLSYAGTATQAGNITVQAGSSGILSILGLTNTNAFSGTIALNNNLTVDNITSTKTTTFTGALTESSSALSISKLSGAGAVTFSTGATTIGAGGLTLNSAGGGVLTFSGGIVSASTGQNLTLNNNGNTGNGITISSNSLNNQGQITNSGSGGVNIVGTGAGSVLISSVIGTNVTAINQNSATSPLILSNANLFTFALPITTGVVNIQNATALGTTAGGTSVSAGAALQMQGTITVGAEALTLNGTGIANDGALRNIDNTAKVWQGAVTLGSSGVRINSDANTLTFNTAATSISGTNTDLILGGAGGITIATPISLGSGQLIKDGSGTLTLSAASNAFTGNVVVGAGTLSLTGSISGTATPLVLSGGTFAYSQTGTNAQTLYGVTVNGGASVINNTIATDTLTLGGITRGSTRGVIGFNTVTGAIQTTALNANGIIGPWATTGTTTNLRYAIGSADGTTSTTITALTGTTATATTLSNVTSATTNYEYSAAATTIGALTGNTLRYSGGATMTLLSNTLTLNGLMQAGSGTLFIAGGIAIGSNNELVIVANGQPTTIYAPIADGASSGALTYSGSNTLTLFGANTYSGPTTITSNTLAINSIQNAGSTVANSLGKPVIGSSSIIGLATGGTLQYFGATVGSNSSNRVINLASATGGTFTLDASGIATSASSGATFALSGGITTSGTSGISTLTLTGGNTAASGTFGSESGNIVDGTGTNFTAVTKTGRSVWTLSGTNTYYGVTNISQGVLNIRNSAALGGTTLGTVVASGASLQLQGGISVGSEALSINGNGNNTVAWVGNYGGALDSVSGSNTYGGPILLAGGSRVASDADTLTLSNNNSITAENQNLSLGGAGNITVSGAIKIGTGTLTKDGAGIVMLNGTNYTGALTISGGTLQVGNTTSGSLNTTGQALLTGPALTFNGGSFIVNEASGVSQIMGALTFSNGESVVQSINNGSNSFLSFSSIGARAVGATRNFVVTNGTNGVTNSITLAGQAPGYFDQGSFFGGGNYAWMDGAGTFVRGINYASDMGAATIAGGSSLPATGVGGGATAYAQTTGAITAQSTQTLTTLNIAGDYNFTLGTSQTLTVNGILKSGNNGSPMVLSGGTAVQPASGAELVIRTDQASDVMTISTPLAANGGRLTKSGAGTLNITGTGATGALIVNAGTLNINNVNTFATGTVTTPAAASGAQIYVGPGATLNAGGNALSINGANSTGIVVDGGTLTSGSGNIGTTYGNGNFVTVKNNGRWNENGYFGMGGGGAYGSNLQIQSGGQVTITNGGNGGMASGGSGSYNDSITVTGANSAFTYSGTSFHLHYNTGYGTFNVLNGGTATINGILWVGRNNDAAGTINVDGANSVFNATGTQETDYGSIFINVTNGGTFNATGANWYPAYYGGSNMQFKVDGANSTFNNKAGAFYFSYGGSYGSIIISNGGTFNSTAGGWSYAGGNGNYNSIAITGANSVLNMGAQGLNLGNGTGNFLSVGNGGYLNSTGGTLTLNSNAASLSIGDGNSVSRATANSVALSNATTLLNFNNGRLEASGNGAMASGSGQIVLNGPAYFSTSQAASTVANMIVGTGSLTKEGIGKLTLSNTNIHSGATMVSGGTLVAGILNGGGSLQVSGGATFSLADSTARATTVSALTLASGSNLAFDLVGTNVVDALTSTAAATTTGSVGISINGVSTPVLNVAQALISSANGGLQTAGSTQYFVANNTNFTATLTQSDTVVSLATYTSGVSALTNAYWVGGQVTGALGSMAFSSSTTSNWASAAAGTLANGVVPGGNAVNVTFGSAIRTADAVTTGADMNLGSLTFNDSTSVILGGTNAITLNNTTATPATSTAALATILTSAGGAVSGNNISAITVTSYANASNTINAPLILAANQTWNVASGKTLTVNGVVGGASTLTIGSAGNTGTVILSGANVYFGATTVTASVLNIQHATALGSAGLGNAAAGTTVSSGAALQIQGGITVGAEALSLNGTGIATDGALRNINGNNVWQGAVTLAGATRINSDAGSLTFNTAAVSINGTQNLTLGGLSNGTVAGQITTSTGTLTKDGTGTWALNGQNTNTGVTTISNGTLQFGKQVSLYNNTTGSWTAANIKVGSGGTLALNVGGTGEFTTANVTTLLTNLGGLGGTVTSNGLQSGSAIAFDTTNASPTNITIADNIANSLGTGGGAIGVTKLGVNTLTLTGTNAYTGSTTIGAGTLTLGSGSAAGTLSASSAIVDNGVFAINRSGAVVQGTDFSSAAITGTGSLAQIGSSTTTLNAANSYQGTTTVENGTLIVGANAPSGSAGALGNATSAIALGDATSITGNLSPSLLTGGDFGVGRNITVGASNTATSGVYTIGGNTANTSSFSGNIALNQSLTVGQVVSGTLNLTGNITSGAAGTQTLTFNNAGAISLSTGVIGGGTGTIAVTQSGNGTTTLSANNTYAGNTLVSSGSLTVGGTLGNTAITVNAGATLKVTPGGGTLYAGTNASTGTSSLTLNGGSSAANFTMVDGAVGAFNIGTGGLTTTTGAQLPVFTFEIGGTLNSIDKLDLGTMGGSASIAAGTKVNFVSLAGNTSLAVGDYTFMTASSGLGSSAFTLESTILTVGGRVYDLSLANSLTSAAVLHVAPAPGASYTLEATASSLNIRAGTGTSTIGATVTNLGSSQDTLVFTNLDLDNRSLLTGSTLPVTGATLAIGAASSGSGSFSASAGAYTFTPTVATAINGTVGGDAILGTATPVTVNVYNLASPGTVSGSIGSYHVGHAKALSLTNVTAGSHNEDLYAGITAVTNTTVSGAVTGLLAGATDNSHLLVTLGGGAGAQTGEVTVDLTSAGAVAGVSNTLGTTPLTSQTVSISGTGYNLAAADGTQTLNLGAVHVGGASALVTLHNTAPVDATYTETLGSGAFSATTAGISTSGSVSGIVGGGSASGTLRVGFDGSVTAGPGKSGSTIVALNSTAVNGSGLGTTSVGSQTITVTGDVFDGTGTWTLSSGSAGSWAANANWTDGNGVHGAPGTFAGYDNVDTALFDGTGTTATIDLDSAAPSLKALTLSGATSYTIAQGSGTNKLTLKSNSGTATVTVGGTQAITAPVTLTSNSTFGTALVSDALTISGNVDGAGSLTKSGSGKLTLDGASNTFGGGIQINGGTLSFSTSLPTNSVTFGNGSAGILEYTGSSALTGSYNLFGTAWDPQYGTVKVTDPAGSITVNRGWNGNYWPLNKTGPGTLTLANGNSDAGYLTVSEGTVILTGTSNNLGWYDNTAGISDVKAGATLKLGNNNPANIPYFNNSFHMSGGTYDVNGFTVNGVVPAINGSGTVTNGSTAAATANFNGYGDGTVTFSGNIVNGAGKLGIGLTGGNNTWTLSGNNTYSGDTTVSSGTLKAGSTTAFSPNSAYAVSATLNLNGFNNSIGSLTGAGNVALGTATLTLGNDNTNPAAFSGAISSTGSPVTSLVKTGSGIQPLSGTNTYTGATNVSQGTLQLALGTSNNNIASSSSIHIASGAALDVSGLNGTHLALANGQTLMGNGSVTGGSVTVSSGAILAPGDSVGTLHFGSGLTLASGGFFNWENTTTNTLGSASTDWDVVNLTGGAVTIDSGAKLNLKFTNGSTDFGTTFWNSSKAWDFITGGASAANPFDVSNIAVFVNGSSVGTGNAITNEGAFSTVVSGNNLQLQWTPIAGTPDQSFTVNTPANPLNVRPGASFGLNATLSNPAAGNLVVNLSNTGSMGITGLSSDLNPVQNGNPATVTGTIQAGATAGLFYWGVTNTDPAATTPNATVSGAVNVYDLANAKYTGATLAFGNVHQGASVANQTVAIGNQTVTDASYQDSLDVSATTGNAKVTATGFTALAASNSGATTENLSFHVDTSTPGSLASTAILTLASNANGVGGLSNGTATVVGSPTAITTTGGVYSGQMVWSGASGNWSTNGDWTDSVGGGAQAAPGADSNFAGVDSATFGASGTHTVTVDQAANLNALSFNGLGDYTLASGAGSLTLAGAAAGINVASGTQAINAPLAMASNVAVTVTSGALAIGGNISGGGNLAKNGGGTLTLSGTNNYGGDTTVNTGTLYINGANTGLGTVTVEPLATLGGTGSIHGAVHVTGTGILSPGVASLESLATGALTLDSGSRLVMEALNTTSNADLMVVTGNLTLTSPTLDLTGLSGTWAAGSRLTLLSYTGSLTGIFNGLADDTSYLFGANYWMLNYNAPLTAKGTNFVADVPVSGAQLVTVTLDAYKTWASAASFSADSNNDGVANGLAWILGATNPSANSNALLPTASVNASKDLILTFKRLEASIDQSTLILEYSTSLTSNSWTDVTITANGGTDPTTGVVVTVTPGTPSDTISVRIPVGKASGGKLFSRLKATQP